MTAKQIIAKGEEILKEHPNYNHTQIALEIVGGYRQGYGTELYYKCQRTFNRHKIVKDI